ncbi:MAG: hypothetical protein A4E32_01255 [Methanomassiliicoccales archaeon PtaU1.Bin124]|nr:MAG: hypothetical protein A4E32_01255 [Methanomassiliicoccales archaeon PtaU1.Bin124]
MLKRIRFLVWGHFSRIEKAEIALILILGLLAFTWVPSGLVVDTFDYGFSFDPERTFQNAFYIWDANGGIGTVTPRNIPSIMPNGLYYFVMSDVIGFSLHWSQAIMFYIILAGSGISMFLLFRSLGFDQKYRHGAVFAGVLYMFSPVASMFLWNQFTTSYYSFVFMPLMAALMLDIIKARKGPLYIFVLAAIWSLLITSSYMNPVNAVIDWTFFTSLVFVVMLTQKTDRKRIVLQWGSLVVIWVAINLYWIVPMALYSSTEFAKADVGHLGVTNHEIFMSNSVPITSAIFQTGYWGLTGTYLGDNWYSWSNWASSAPYLLGLAVITIFAWAGLVHARKNRIVLYFGLLAVFSLIMINGTNWPTGDFMLGLFDRYPFLYAFRSIFQKFGPLLTMSYAVLCGLVMGIIINYLYINKQNIFRIGPMNQKVWTATGLGIVMLLAISMVAVPYVNGQIFYRGGEVIPSALVDVPDYYHEADDWLTEQDGDFRLLGLPYCKIGYSAYDWQDGLWAGDPSASLFHKTVITSEYGDLQDLMVNISYSISIGKYEYNITKMLSVLNVRYIILHEDTNWKFIYQHEWWVGSTSNFTTYYDNMIAAGFFLSHQSGELYLFENPEWKDIEFYQTNTLVKIKDVEVLKNLTKESWFDVGKMGIILNDDYGTIYDYLDALTIIFYPESTTESGSNVISNTSTEYVKVSSTERIIDLDPDMPILIFSERYDPNWKYQGSEKIVHVKLNLFFNGYIVSNNTDDTVALHFSTQYYLFIFLFIGPAMAIMLTLVFFDISRIREFIRKRRK